MIFGAKIHICHVEKIFHFTVYLILGIVFMSLTLSVFYDIPQLNLGLQLHSYADIRFNDNTKTLETSSVASMKEAWNEQQSKVSKVLSSGTTTPKTSAPVSVQHQK